MSLRDEMSRAAATEHRERRAANACRRRFDTATVGAVAAVERAFGALWGHGRPPRSAAEEAWGAVWMACRDEIFDVGNGQSRALLSDLNKRD